MIQKHRQSQKFEPQQMRIPMLRMLRMLKRTRKTRKRTRKTRKRHSTKHFQMQMLHMMKLKT